MAGKTGNQNAVGNSGGKSLQDRELAAEVRSLTLMKIQKLFTMPRVDMTEHDASLHDRILEKLAGTVLPRLTEVTGKDGSDLFPVPILTNTDVSAHQRNRKDSEA